MGNGSAGGLPPRALGSFVSQALCIREGLSEVTQCVCIQSPGSPLLYLCFLPFP